MPIAPFATPAYGKEDADTDANMRENRGWAAPHLSPRDKTTGPIGTDLLAGAALGAAWMQGAAFLGMAVSISLLCFGGVYSAPIPTWGSGLAPRLSTPSGYAPFAQGLFVNVLDRGVRFLAVAMVVLGALTATGAVTPRVLLVCGVLGSVLVLRDAARTLARPPAALVAACRGLTLLTVALLVSSGGLGPMVMVGAVGATSWIAARGSDVLPKDRGLPRGALALLASPFAFLLLHYWSVLALLAGSAISLGVVGALRCLHHASRRM